LTPIDLNEARRKLGLTLEELALMLGYAGPHAKTLMWRIANGARVLREPQRRLVQAYLDGYRPQDWPR
jgi:hypothetical protein